MGCRWNVVYFPYSCKQFIQTAWLVYSLSYQLAAHISCLSIPLIVISMFPELKDYLIEYNVIINMRNDGQHHENKTRGFNFLLMSEIKKLLYLSTPFEHLLESEIKPPD